MKPLPTVSAAAVTLLLLSAQVHAQDTLVTRCSVNVNGTFVPALILRVNGAQKVFKVGEAGLTHSIVFNEQKAIGFAQTLLDDSAGPLVYVDCGGLSDGSDGADSPVVVPVTTTTPPPPPPPPVDDGGDDSPPGGGCGYDQ